MTGEISLTGKVIPIGGVKEKMMAAKTKGIKHVILPYDNRGHYHELDEPIKSGITVHFVKHFSEAYQIAFGVTLPPSSGSSEKKLKKRSTTPKTIVPPPEPTDKEDKEDNDDNDNEDDKDKNDKDDKDKKRDDPLSPPYGLTS